MERNVERAAFALLALACIAAILWLAFGRSDAAVAFFAYGASLAPDTMDARAGGYLNASAARLEGYRLAFQAPPGSEFGVANLVSDADSSVDGAVYWLSEKQARQLWEKSGAAGFYRKILVEVRAGGRKLNATAYVLSGPQAFMPPSRPYLEAAAAGMGHFGHGQEGDAVLAAAAAEAQARKGEPANR